MSDSPSCMTRKGQRGGARLGSDAYRTLADFRYLIRRFLEFSSSAARAAELTPRQHQALLAIKGFPAERSPSVGQLAKRLMIQHHSAVELVDRLVEAGLIVRSHDSQDRRRVLLQLTDAAEDRLAELSAVHLEELQRLQPALLEILRRVETDGAADPVTRVAAQGSRSEQARAGTKRPRSSEGC